MAVLRARTQTYQVIAIDGDRLRYDAYAVDGTRIDDFELQKSGAGPSLYIDGNGR
jgi:hypothetical protein